jgi:hypothetical protein
MNLMLCRIETSLALGEQETNNVFAALEDTVANKE